MLPAQRSQRAKRTNESILTTRENGSLRMSRSVLFWYFLISRRATVPGLNRFSARVGVGWSQGERKAYVVFSTRSLACAIDTCTARREAAINGIERKKKTYCVVGRRPAPVRHR